MRKELKGYLVKKVRILKELVDAIDTLDNSLEFLKAYKNNEEFFYMFENSEKALSAIIFGNYNSSDEYIRFNSYGSIETLTEEKYEEQIIDNVEYIIDRLEELHNNIHIDDSVIKEYVEQLEENF